MQDPYQLLGVAEDATVDELRAAWRRVARATHPDTGGDAAAFAAAKAAFELLSDPARRAAWDQSRAASRAEAAAGRGPGAAGELGALLSRIAELAVAERSWTAALETATDQLARQARAEAERCWRELETAHVELGRVCAVLALDPRPLAVPELVDTALAAWDAARPHAGSRPGPLPGPTSGTDSWPASPWEHPTAITVPEAGHAGTPAHGGPEFVFADGTEVHCTRQNRHGAWVVDEGTRRRFRMGPDWVLERLRPDDEVLQLAAPIVGELTPWQLIGHPLVFGPRWIIPGAWWPAAVVGAVIGAAAGFAAGTGVALPAFLGALVLAWWPLRLATRLATATLARRMGRAQAGVVVGATMGLAAAGATVALGAGALAAVILVLGGTAFGALPTVMLHGHRRLRRRLRRHMGDSQE